MIGGLPSRDTTVSIPFMKSAFELAMERFKDDDENSRPITDEQREALAETDRKFQAKIAEKEVFLNQKIKDARLSGDREAVAQIEKQLHLERERLNAEKEVAKEKIRKGS